MYVKLKCVNEDTQRLLRNEYLGHIITIKKVSQTIEIEMGDTSKSEVSPFGHYKSAALEWERGWNEIIITMN
jgi:hypothetical protein